MRQKTSARSTSRTASKGLGGTSTPRWILVDDHIRGALGFTEKVLPAGSRNLISPNESDLNALQEIVRTRDILHAHNLKGFHELRATFACERYERVTQHLEPVNGGKCCRMYPRLDREARRQISYELGHGRIDIVAAYIGAEASMCKPFDMELVLAGVLTGSHATRPSAGEDFPK